MKNVPYTITAALLGVIIAAGCTPTAKKSPTTPDGAAKQLINAFGENCPDHAFALLPESYQDDLNGVVKDFATRMDADIWNGLRDRCSKIASIAKGKRSIIIEAINKAAPMPEADAGKIVTSFDQTVKLLSTLSGSKLTDLNALRKGNIAKLLASDGRGTMENLSNIFANVPSLEQSENPWAVMKSTKIELVESADDSATLKIITSDDSTELKMTKVEGVWIPADMAEEWNDTISEMTESISAIDFTTDEGKQQKTQIMAMFGMVDGIITQLEGAKTADDITVIGSMLMGQVMGMMMGGMGGSTGGSM